MSKSILTTRADSAYDDVPEDRYHFPRTYLRQIERSLGDQIIYYEPRRGLGRQAYVAVARLTRVEADHTRADHYYVYVEDYLDFLQPVPFREGDHFHESVLRNREGTVNLGAFQRSVRGIPELEFERICDAGFKPLIDAPPAVMPFGFPEEPESFDRPVNELLVRRPFRDQAFKRNVRSAYAETCALSGIRLINGGGRPESEAAHIKPIGDGHQGTDSVRNGIALCQTVHWMFDRGIISLEDDYSVLLSAAHVSTDLRRLLRPELKAKVPDDPLRRPHPQFLSYHRTVVCRDYRLVRADTL